MSGSVFGGPIRRLQRILKQVRALIHQEAHSSHRPVRHLRLMQLEDRRVLNASLAIGAGVELTGGEDLLIQDGGIEDVGGGSLQTVDLEITDGTWSVDAGIDEDFYDVSADGKTLTVDQALIDDGGVALDASDALLIQGSDLATDTLVVDVMGMDFVPSGGIEFSGGEDPGNLDNDSLEIKGYELTTADGVADVTVTHTGTESGSVELAGIGTIEFDEIEPLTLSGDAADLVIQLPAGADNDVVLSDDGNADDGVSQIASPTNSAFETTTFSNPTNSLTIVDGSGAKTINVEGLDSLYDADLTINADSDDTVQFQTNALDLNGGNLYVSANTITANVDISTTASTAGSITLMADGDVTTGWLNTSGSNTGGDIDVQSATGSIDIDAVISSSSISSSGSVGGNVSLTADGDITTGNFESAAYTAAGTISLTANGGITTVYLNSSSEVQGGAISLVANGDISTGVIISGSFISAGDVLVQSDAGSITTGNVLATSDSDVGGQITLNAHTTIDAGLLASFGDQTGGDIQVKSNTGSMEVGRVISSADPTLSGSTGGSVSLDAATGIEFDDINSEGQSAGGTISVIVGGTASQSTGSSVSGNGTLNKQGSGTLVFSEANDYTGATTVNVGTLQVATTGATDSNTVVADGTLVVDGEIDGDVTVNGGTLKGTGTVTGDVTVNTGGTLAPGNSPGVISTSDLNLAAGSASDFEIQDTNSAGATAGTDYDQVNVTGTVTIDPSATLTVDTTGSTDITAGEEYILISNDGTDAVSGTFSGLAEGAVVSTDIGGSGSAGVITYAGGDGNDVAILVTDVTVTVDGSGNLVVNDSIGTDDTFVITDDGTSVTIHDPDKTIGAIGIAGAVQVNANTVTIDKSQFAGEVIVNGNDGNDSLTVDFSEGNFSRAITFNGGGQTGTPGDSLILTGGGTFSTVTHAATNAADGTVSVTGNALITYTGLEPVFDNLDVNNRVFQFAGAAETITLSDDGEVGDGESLIDSTLSESILFVNPNVSLTIETNSAGGSGADVINVQGLDSTFDASLTITADSVAGEEDTVNFQTDATDIGATNRNLSVTANVIDIDQAVDASGTVDLMAASHITIGADVTSGGTLTAVSTGGNITFAGGRFAAGLNTVILNAGGAIIDNDAGLDIQSLSAELIAGAGIGSADAIDTQTANLAFNNTGTQQANITNTGQLNIAELTGVGGTLTSSSTTGGGTISAGSPIQVNASITTGADFTLEALGDAGPGNDTNDHLTINANVTHTGAAGVAKTINLRADDDVRFSAGTVSFANTNAGDTLNVTADSAAVTNADANTTGAIVHNAFAGPLTAANINLTAASGIGVAAAVRTSADSVTFTNSDNNVQITEANAATFTGTNGSGSTRLVTTLGDLTVGLGDIVSNSGDVTLNAQGVGASVVLLDGAADSSVVDTTGGATAGAAVTIIADDLDIQTALVTNGMIDSGTGLVTLRPHDVTRAIDVGGAGGAGDLDITDAELDRITSSGGLTIGSAAQTGNISTTAVISPANLSGGTLLFETGGAATITVTGAGTINSPIATTFRTNTGDIILAGGSVNTTNDDITFDGTVQLDANSVISSDTGGGDVVFTGTVDADGNANNRTLQVTAGTGNVDFQDNIGATQALDTLTVVSSTTTDLENVVTRDGGIAVTATNIRLNGGSLDTTDEATAGGISLDGNVVLTTNVAITTDATVDGDVTVTGEVNADAAANNRSLQVTAGTGTVDFQGDIGTTEAIEALNIVSAATVSLQNVDTRDGGIYVTATTINLDGTLYDTTDQTTAGAINFNGTTVLNANVVIDTDTTTDANVTFNGLVRADTAANDRRLDVTAGTGTVDFTGQIGNGNSLADLDVQASTIILSGDVQVDAFDATADGIITLDGDVELQNSLINIDLDDGLVGTAAYSLVITGDLNADAAANDRRLSVSTRGGTVDFRGQIGNTQTIDDLDVNDSNPDSNPQTTIQFGGDVTVDGTGGNDIVRLDGNVVVDADVTFNLGGTNDKALTVTGTFDDDAAAPVRAVVIDTGSEDISVGGAVGGTNALGSLTIANAGNVEFQSTVDADSLTQTAGSGTTTFNGGAIGGNLDVTTTNVVFASGSLAATGTADVTATGSITGGTDDGVADLTGTVITLESGAAGIGTTGTSLDLFASTRLDASTTAAGADFFIDGIGDLNLGSVNAGTGTAALSATTAIVDARAGEGAGSENIIAANAALRAADGIGHFNDIDVNLTNMAFSNTASNNVNITDVAGGLTINSVDGLLTSSNAAGNITLVTASPMTFAVDMTAAGNILIQALESGVVNFDNITVNMGVTVESTGGEVTFEAGDRIIINDMAVVTASGAGGDVTFDSGFADTDTDGSMTLNGTVAANATDGIVRLDLNAQGAATQGVDGSITGNGLQLVSTAATGSFDLDAGTTNDVAIIAATTDGAVIEYRDADTLAVGTVDGINGINTVSAAVTLCVITGNLDLQQSVTAGAGTVRLQTNGATSAITQDENNSSITAAALGARSGSGGISLDSSTTNVTTFAASTTGALIFAEADGFSVGAVGANACFTATTGITTMDSDMLITSGGSISLTAAVNAGTGTVRIAGNGDITQTAAGTITANELGVRQESGAGGDILLGDANAVDEFAASNAFASGQIVFNNTQATTIGSVAEFTDPFGNTFTATTGVVSTNGNVLIQSADTLFLDEQVNAGMAEVRLIGNGLISQDAEGIISASELGVRQQSAVAGDIQLAFENVVDEFAASNAFDSGSISFRSTLAVTVGTSAASTVDGVAFALTTGVVSTNGDVLIDTDGSLFVDNAINAGTADVRLIGNGNITQDINGSITANTLAVRQDAMTGNIVLCFGNAVDELAAFNTADSGTIDFESTRDLTIGAVTAQTIDNITFAATTGVTSSDGDIFIDTVRTLSVEQVINAGTADVRLVGLGNITQTADGIITANALGVRNESGLAGNITLDQANNVDVFAASNSFGDVAFRSTRDLTIGELISFTDSCGNIFGTTTGIRTFGEDVLVQSDRSLFLDEAINVGMADVRLIGNGDIHQDAEGIITAVNLGVRQQNATFAMAGDLDANGDFDVHLCEDNVVSGNVAVQNAESGGDILFNSTAAYAVGTVGVQTSGSITFASTSGLAATDGDLLLSSGGAINLTTALDAGTGTVRIAGNGDITQTAAGTITANELAVRQESAAGGDILLGDANAVNEFAAFNAFATGQIVFDNTLATTVGSVAEFMDPCGNTFAATTGVVSTNGNVLIQSADTLFLDEQVNAGMAEVRLIGNGLISQDAEGIISASELGVRQQSAVAGDIQLAFENVVDEFAASNAFDSGSISFRSTLAVTVGTSAASTVDGVAFALTTGVVSTNGDVLIDTDGSLFVDNAINAGTADVRLIGNGNITQDINGSITANTLAVRQDAMTGNIVLCFGNAVDELAAFNTADSGTIDFESTRDLTIGAVTAQTIDNITFAATTGVTSSDGDIFIDTVRTLSVEQVINAGTADVRLVGLGNITQTADGIITANALGVRNESGLAGNITLDQANNVDVFAASNSFGDVAFRSTRDLTIGELISFTDSCGNIFGTTTGIRTSGGDAKIVGDMSLAIDDDIMLGTGNLFLDVTGNVTQQAGDDITANGLGLMVDGNTTLDNAGNNVVTLAADNMGTLTYRDADTLTIDTVTVDGMTVTGVFTIDDDVTINVLAGNLNIVQAVNTRGGNLVANAAADITSTVPGTVTTSDTVANQDSGTVQLTAGQNVALQGTVDSSGFDNAGGTENSDGGDITITATAGSIAVDDVTSSGGDVSNGTGGNAGTIAFDAGTTINFNDNPAVTDPADGDISSTGGQNLSSGIRTGDGADLVIPDALIIAASDADGETQTVNTSGATAGDVTFQSTVDGATDSVNDLTIDARDTDAENLANPASGNVTFAMDVGATTRLGDLTISDANNFTAMQLIRATSLTQTAGIGNTTLNEVNIQTVTTGPSSGVAISTDYTINLRGNITVADSTMLVDNTAATGETIEITSIDGNIIMEDGVIVSTDEDPAAGQSSEFTGDALTISADTVGTARRAYVAAERDSDADGTADDIDIDLDGDGTLDADPADADVPTRGLFKAGPNSELRTDGGVAKRFIPFIDPDGLISPTITNDTSDQVNFRTEWEVEVGVQGEENLRVNVDWRDPNDDPTMFADSSTSNPVTSNRQQTFLVRDEAGGANPPVEAIAHEYNILDFVDFINAETASFPADFSVSHHESIVVNGSQLDQGPLSGPEAIPGGVITTTDNPNTGTGVADPGTDVTDPVDSNSDLNFETGLFEVIIPTNIGFVPQVEPERPVPNPEPAVAPPVAAQTLVQFVPNDLADFPASSYSSQSEDYFQLRQDSTEAVEGFEHIDSDIGWKLLQPRRLKEWVYSNDLDGRGYELWLITTKVKDGRNITFERPVLKFDVFDNQPFPMEEEILDQLPEMKLEELQLDEEGNPEADSVPEEDRPEEQVVPEDETISKTDPVKGEFTRAAVAGLAVSSVMSRTRYKRRTRQHVAAVSQILNRIPR